MKTDRPDVYSEITATIITLIEQGVPPWRTPWETGSANARPLRACGIPYRGINTVVLWAATANKGYTSPYWLTFNQARDLGGMVRKGERGTGIVFSGAAVKKVAEGETSGEETPARGFRFLKRFVVFNANQIDGLPDRFFPVIPEHKTEPVPVVSAFVEKAGVSVIEEGVVAAYNRTRDVVRMPPAGLFVSPQAWAATLLHEAVHWTGAPARLARSMDHAFGSKGYAFEELVAELGSAFLCADLAVVDHPREESAAYLEHWLSAMRADKTYIFKAASAAAKACDYLHGTSDTETEARLDEVAS